MKIAHRKLRARIFQPENRASFTKFFIPPAGSLFSEAGLEAAVATVLADIKRKLPDHEYRAVKIGPASFNFVWVAKVASAAATIALAFMLAGCTRVPAKAKAHRKVNLLCRSGVPRDGSTHVLQGRRISADVPEAFCLL